VRTSTPLLEPFRADVPGSLRDMAIDPLGSPPEAE
jgi:hypothetical protein